MKEGEWKDTGETQKLRHGDVIVNIQEQPQLCKVCDNDTFRIVERSGQCPCEDYTNWATYCAKCGRLTDF